jgi:release factor glutamine methyltransferase
MLAAVGIESFAADARLLLCAAGGLQAKDLIRDPETALGEATMARLAPMAERRAAREPLSRILGSREFWGLPLTLSPDVLDPRPDTETLVEAVLRELPEKRHAPLRILDLGVGSGAILCALLKEFDCAFGVGVDISTRAAAVAQANLGACDVASRAAIVVGAWTSALRGPFDIVVSNPPYIPSGEIAGLESEVRDHDPVLALDGGRDGLDAYRDIARQIGPLLGADGRLFLEVGAGQASEVITILERNRITDLTAYKDLAGLDRVVRGGARGNREARP